MTVRPPPGGGGVLALLDGGDAYAVPASLHYDESGRLLLRPTDDGDSESIDYAATTERATRVAFERVENDSRSVLARGRRSNSPPGSATRSSDREPFGPVRTFDEDVPGLRVRVFDPGAESLTGRRTAGVDAWRAVAGVRGDAGEGDGTE